MHVGLVTLYLALKRADNTNHDVSGCLQIYLDKQGNLMLRVSWLYRQREVKAAGVKFRPEEIMYSRCDAQCKCCASRMTYSTASYDMCK